MSQQCTCPNTYRYKDECVTCGKEWPEAGKKAKGKARATPRGTKCIIDFGNDGVKVEARLAQDVNHWRAKAGTICGTGNTPMGAIVAFRRRFRNGD